MWCDVKGTFFNTAAKTLNRKKVLEVHTPSFTQINISNLNKYCNPLILAHLKLRLHRIYIYVQLFILSTMHINSGWQQIKWNIFTASVMMWQVYSGSQTLYTSASVIVTSTIYHDYGLHFSQKNQTIYHSHLIWTVSLLLTLMTLLRCRFPFSCTLTIIIRQRDNFTNVNSKDCRILYLKVTFFPRT